MLKLKATDFYSTDGSVLSVIAFDCDHKGKVTLIRIRRLDNNGEQTSVILSEFELNLVVDMAERLFGEQ